MKLSLFLLIGFSAFTAAAQITAGSFESAVAPPMITSFSPQSGPIGTVVTITGTNFSANPLANRVSFGAVTAQVLGGSSNSLTVAVPMGATYEPISVITSNFIANSDRPFTITFDSTHVPNTDFFAPAINYSAGAVYVAVGDINHDGRPDLVVPSLTRSNISVLINGATSFACEPYSFSFGGVSFRTGPMPFSITLADLDVDGRLDAITPNIGDHTISLLRNVTVGPDVAFATPVSLPVGLGPLAVAVSDLDKDGRPDIVVANLESDTVSIYRNIGPPFASVTSNSFAPRLDIPVGDGPYAVIIADVDGDGHQDIIAANHYTATLAIIHHADPTAGPFAPAVHFPRGGTSLAFGDLDGDGKGDIAVVNYNSHTLSIFRNVSSPGLIAPGSLAAPVDFRMPNNPYTVGLNDLDGDARAEIVVVGESPHLASIFHNLSSPGTLDTSSFGARLDFPSGSHPRGLGIVDLDGDGPPDIVCANPYSFGLSIYRNRSFGASPPIITRQPEDQTLSVGGTAVFHVEVNGAEPLSYLWRKNMAPIDGATNGILTISNVGANDRGFYSVLVSNLCGSVASTQAVLRLANFPPAEPPAISFEPRSGPVGSLVVIRSTNFSPSPLANIVSFGAVTARVLSVTSNTLLVVVPYGATYERISVTTSNRIVYSDRPFIVTFSSSQFTAGSIGAPVFFPTGDHPMDVALGDMNGDGRPELVVPNHFHHNIGVYLNRSTNLALTPGSFAPAVLFATGPLPFSVTVADLDGDGRLDVITPNVGNDTISILLNVSVGTNVAFAPTIILPVGRYPAAVAVGDLNRDGRPDIVVANSESDTVSIYRNIGPPYMPVNSNSFAPRLDVPIGDGPHAVMIADVDGDWHQDIIVANYNSYDGFHRTMAIIHNADPTWAITPAVHFPGGGNSLAFGDLDDDGRQDIVVADHENRTVSLFRNLSSPGDITPASLAAPIDLVLDYGPYTVALSDLDGDARLDLVTIDGVYMSIFRNVSSPGTLDSNFFSARVSIPTGTRGLAIGDLNSDTRPDIACASDYNDRLNVFLNQTIGASPPLITYQPASQTVSAGTNVSFSVEVTGSEPLRYTWRQNDIPLPGATSRVLTLSSVTTNNNGFYSVIVSNTVGFTVSSNAQLHVTGHPPTITRQPFNQTVPVGDTAAFTVEATGMAPLSYQWFKDLSLPLPGATDRILTINNVSSNDVGSYSVLVSNTVGSVMSTQALLRISIFPPDPPPMITSFSPQSGPTGTVVTIEGMNFSPNALANRVYFGGVRARVLVPGTNNLLRVEVPVGATYEPISVVARNRIAYSDRPFVVTFPSTRTIHRESFAGFNLPAGDLPIHVSLGDMNRDGKVDMVVANHYGGTVSVYLNRSTNFVLEPVSFEPALTYPTGSQPLHMALADFDGGGGLDVVTANYGDGTISLLRNTPTGTFALAPPLHFPAGQLPSALAVGDLDKDGRTDIVVANQGSDSITIFRQISNPFSPLTAVPFSLTEIPVSDGPHNIIIGDIDSDGAPDIVVTHHEAPTIAVLRNLTAAPGIDANSFAPPVYFPRGGKAIAFGDLDGDGKPDIAVGNWRTQTLSLFRNIASPGVINPGSLGAPVDFALGYNIHTVAFSDLDGDGRPDIALVGELDSHMSILKNLSSPSVLDKSSFAPPVDFPAGWNAVGIVAGDLDGDSRPDLLFANAYDDTITVYHNETILPPANEPPIARATASPALDFLSEGSTYVILAQDGQARVVLDGTASTDPEGDSLSYQWSRNGMVFSTDPMPILFATPFAYELTLTVSDGFNTNSTTIIVEVIELDSAIQALVLIVDESNLSRRSKRPIIASLKAAAMGGDHGSTLNQLQGTQAKIDRQIGNEDPALAALLNAAIQEIIDALSADP